MSDQRADVWYLLHTLAALSMLLLAIAFSSLIYFSVTDRVPKLDPQSPFWTVGSLSLVTLLWLWLWMLIDFFRQRPVRHPVAWGWFLILGSYIGGLAYFWAVWRPRNRPHDT